MTVKIYNPEAASDVIHFHNMIRYGAEIMDKEHILDIANQLEKMGFYVIVVKKPWKDETIYAVWRSLRKDKSGHNVGHFGGKPKKTMSHKAKIAHIEQEVKEEIAVSKKILKDIQAFKRSHY